MHILLIKLVFYIITLIVTLRLAEKQNKISSFACLQPLLVITSKLRQRVLQKINNEPKKNKSLTYI